MQQPPDRAGVDPGDLLLAQNLQEAAIAAAALGTIVAGPREAVFLRTSVDLAMQVTSATQGSLLLVDKITRHLRIEVSRGPHSSGVTGMTVPAGQGIAGLVAATGEPMLVADAGQDPRHAAEIARATGYTPRSILCVPLLCREEVIGILELMDKRSAHTFDTTDLAVVTHLAAQTASLLELAAIQQASASSIIEALRLPNQKQLAEAADAFTDRVRSLKTFQDAITLAELVRDIALCGSAEVKLCKGVLTQLSAYTRREGDWRTQSLEHGR